MTEQIAIYYESTTIYWSSVLLCAALTASFCVCFALYRKEHEYGIVIWAYWLAAAFCSLYLSRIIHWYCHMEQYEDFWTALTRLDQGEYSIVGILLGSWIVAVLFSGLRMVRSRYEILDAAAPGLAFLLAMVRFCDAFGGACLGKNRIREGKGFFSHTTQIGGITQTRFAAFQVSFLWLLLVTVLCLILFLLKKRSEGERERGSVYQTFLILFAMSEIPLDSIRYDSLHLFFYGSRLAELNKVAGFVGLSQIAAALILLGYILSFSVRQKFRNVGSLLIFAAGLALAGVCEYLVQRYTADYIRWYVLQTGGSLMMGLGCLLAKKAYKKPG